MTVGNLNGWFSWALGPQSRALYFAMVILGGSVFKFFRSDVCSQSYEVKHASYLHAFDRCVRARVDRSAKITVSIHWTVPSNFQFIPLSHLISPFMKNSARQFKFLREENPNKIYD